MNRIFALVALVLAPLGCEEPERFGTSDTIAIFWARDRPPSDAALIQIEESFGMEVIEVDQPYGAVSIFLYDDESGELKGGSGGYIPCGSSVWAIGSPTVIAHEVGHAFGLAHTDEVGNLMHPSLFRAPFTIDEEQLSTVRAAAWEFEQCRDEVE